MPSKSDNLVAASAFLMFLPVVLKNFVGELGACLIFAIPAFALVCWAFNTEKPGMLLIPMFIPALLLGVTFGFSVLHQVGTLMVSMVDRSILTFMCFYILAAGLNVSGKVQK